MLVIVSFLYDCLVTEPNYSFMLKKISCCRGMVQRKKGIEINWLFTFTHLGNLRYYYWFWWWCSNSSVVKLSQIAAIQIMNLIWYQKMRQWLWLVLIIHLKYCFVCCFSLLSDFALFRNVQKMVIKLLHLFSLGQSHLFSSCSCSSYFGCCLSLMTKVKHKNQC